LFTANDKGHIDQIIDGLSVLTAIPRSTAFSTSSRNFDLNGEARTAKAKQNSPIILPA
jgi:hypothetical protein